MVEFYRPDWTAALRIAQDAIRLGAADRHYGQRRASAGAWYAIALSMAGRCEEALAAFTAYAAHFKWSDESRAHMEKASWTGSPDDVIESLKPFREVEIAPTLELAWARHADWLTTRRDLGRSIGTPRQETGPVEVTVEGKARWPLRIERHADGSVDVTLADEKT